MLPRVLVIAGSDSGGGAGIQADLKTITVLGGYAATAVTALTAQNTLGVFSMLAVDAHFVAQQIRVVLEDVGADAVKTGMLLSADVTRVVAAELSARATHLPVVVDPVMFAKGGAPLLLDDARAALVECLLPIAALVTPNLPEAEALTGLCAASVNDLPRLAERVLELGPAAVLVKGGHLPGDEVVDLLRTADGEEHRFRGPRLETRSTHGTGCTLASAIACGLAEGLRLRDAVERAHRYVAGAIRSAPGIGSGYGPLHHAWSFGAGGARA